MAIAITHRKRPKGLAWEALRRDCLKRDSYRCVRCGFAVVDELIVHHVTPIIRFDNPKDAHYLDNLTTLCWACHPTVEAETKRQGWGL